MQQVNPETGIVRTYTGAAAVDFSKAIVTEVDPEITVTDDLLADWEWTTSESGQVSYELPFSCVATETFVNQESWIRRVNTAKIEQTGQSSTATVDRVCRVGALKVVKRVVWNGHTPVEGQTFTICITGPSYPTVTTPGACQTFTAPHDLEKMWVDLIPGSYEVDETGASPVGGWVVAGEGAVSVVALGQAEATITNELAPALGKITMTKSVVGTTEPWSFTFQLNGGNDRSVNNAGPTATWENLTPNLVYTLSEVNPGAEWQVGAISCLVNNEPVSDGDPDQAGFQVNVTPGAVVTCGITNTRIPEPEPGKIMMTKSVVGTVEPWSFTFQLNGGNDRSVNNAAPTATWENLTPNLVYTLSEVNPGAEWQVGAISCLVNNEPVSDGDPDQAGFQVNVTPGAVVTCGITNSRIPEPGKITVTKVVSGPAVPTWSFQFTLDDANAMTATNSAPVVTWEGARA
ncbi:MAG: hypothetical protein IPK16_25845 [Anaerolineales bacterium]|nr:hypothetical protein [Anaerolineales bacterium]